MPEQAEIRDGGCQCGSIRYRAIGEPILAAICHCTMCRKAHAAPAVAWAIFQDSQLQFGHRKPKQFKSSEPVRRGFCPECGTQISAASSDMTGCVEISIGSLDNPESIPPSFHLWYASHLSWAEFADDLPRYSGFPPTREAENPLSDPRKEKMPA